MPSVAIYSLLRDWVLVVDGKKTNQHLYYNSSCWTVKHNVCLTCSSDMGIWTCIFVYITINWHQYALCLLCSQPPRCNIILPYQWSSHLWALGLRSRPYSAGIPHFLPLNLIFLHMHLCDRFFFSLCLLRSPEAIEITVSPKGNFGFVLLIVMAFIHTLRICHTVSFFFF